LSGGGGGIGLTAEAAWGCAEMDEF